MDEDKQVRKIVPAALFPRTFGALLDLIMVIIVGLGVFIGVAHIFESVPAIDKYRQEYNQIIIDSGLMKYEDKKLVINTFEDYKSYETMFYSFYHDTFSKETKKEYDTYWFNVFVYGQNDTLNKYEQKELDNRWELAKTIAPTLFTYKLDNDNNPLVNEFALPIKTNNGQDELTDSDKAKIMSYFYVSEEAFNNNETAKKYGYVYFFAMADLTSISKLQSDMQQYNFLTATVPVAIAILFAFIIFYFLIPMLFKNGETLGKKIMHTNLVNKLGYQYSKLQLIPRFLFPLFLVLAVIFLFGITMLSFMVISIGTLASYLVTIFTKEHKALHDYFAGTLVVDTRASTWFNNAKEEEETQKQVDEYVENIQSNAEPIKEDNILYTNPHLEDKK